MVERHWQSSRIEVQCRAALAACQRYKKEAKWHFSKRIKSPRCKDGANKSLAECYYKISVYCRLKLLALKVWYYCDKIMIYFTLFVCYYKNNAFTDMFVA